jgi:hypothetical protein
MEMQGKIFFNPGIIANKEFLGKSFGVSIENHTAKILLPQFSGQLHLLGFLSCPQELDKKLVDDSNYNSNKWGVIAETQHAGRKSVKVQINAAGIVFNDIDPSDNELQKILYDTLNDISRTINIIAVISNKSFLPSANPPEIARERIQLAYYDNKKLEYYFEPAELLQNTKHKMQAMNYKKFKDSFVKLAQGFVLNPIYDIFYHAVRNMQNKNYRMAAIDMGTCMDLLMDYIVGNYLKKFIDRNAVNTILSGLYNFKKKRSFVNNTSYFKHTVPNFNFIKKRNKAVHEFKKPPAELLHKEIYGIYDLLMKFGIPLLIKDSSK